jgi:hypothetical protein
MVSVEITCPWNSPGGRNTGCHAGPVCRAPWPAESKGAWRAERVPLPGFCVNTRASSPLAYLPSAAGAIRSINFVGIILINPTCQAENLGAACEFSTSSMGRRPAGLSLRGTCPCFLRLIPRVHYSHVTVKSERGSIIAVAQRLQVLAKILILPLKSYLV